MTNKDIPPIVHLTTDIHHQDQDNIPTNETTNTKNSPITTDHPLGLNHPTITDNHPLPTNTVTIDIISHHSSYTETDHITIPQIIKTKRTTAQGTHIKIAVIHLHHTDTDHNRQLLPLTDHIHQHHRDNQAHPDTEITDHQSHHLKAILTQDSYQV